MIIEQFFLANVKCIELSTSANNVECGEAEKTYLLVTVRGKWVKKTNNSRILKIKKVSIIIPLWN